MLDSFFGNGNQVSFDGLGNPPRRSGVRSPPAFVGSGPKISLYAFVRTRREDETFPCGARCSELVASAMSHASGRAEMREYTSRERIIFGGAPIRSDQPSPFNRVGR